VCYENITDVIKHRLEESKKIKSHVPVISKTKSGWAGSGNDP